MLTEQQFEQLRRDVLAHSDRRTIEYMVRAFATALDLLRQHWPEGSDRQLQELFDQIASAAILCLRDEYLKIRPVPQLPLNTNVGAPARRALRVQRKCLTRLSCSAARAQERTLMHTLRFSRISIPS